MSLEKVTGFHVKSSKKRCSEVLGGARILAEAEQNPSTSLGSSRAPLFSDLNLAEQSRAPLKSGSNEPRNIPFPSTSKNYSQNIYDEIGSVGSNGSMGDVAEISATIISRGARCTQFPANHLTGYRKSLADNRVYCFIYEVGLRTVMIIDAVNGQRLEIPAVVWRDCFIK